MQMFQKRRISFHLTITHQLSDGSILVLLTRVPPRILDPQKYKDKHAQLYVDMFIYLPCRDEEQSLGDANRSKEVCQPMWDEWGDAEKDLKKPLY